MTVALITSIDEYVGLAADAKPTGVPAGSRFRETDSGGVYIYDGAAWALDLAKGAPLRASKTVTFNGAANRGAVGNVPLFTVTGDVLAVYLTAICTVNLGEAAPGGATLALGVTGNTPYFIAATPALDIAAGDIWIDATPTETLAVALPAGFKEQIVRGVNIVGTVAVAAINAGAIRFDLYWLPLSSTGLVVAA